MCVDLVSLLWVNTNPSSPLPPVVPGRNRGNSESQASTASREEELWLDETGTPTEGAPFRVRSKSAPPALWAAKKYGRQLRRMSDEFDSLLDKGVRTTASGDEGGGFFLKPISLFMT